MLDYQLSFNSPWYLTLLALLPLFWTFGWRRLAVLGRARRWIALGVRSLVLVLVVLAMAEVQSVRTADRLTVIYLLDQSLSIPAEQRRAMIEYVNTAIREHRHRDDRAGVVVFGRDATVEIPPFPHAVPMPPVLESELDPEYTNLAGAMKLALACFPEDSAKRVVVVSDGNENLGDALEEARHCSGSGVGIDVVPVRYQAPAEIVVERLAIPNDVRRGQPFDVRVVVSNTTEPAGSDSPPVRGRLVIVQSASGQSRVVSEESVVLPPGKRVFTIRQQIDEPSFYTYEARFVADRAEDDARTQNNRATGFAQVRGKGRVLLVEDFEHPGEFDGMVHQWRLEGLDVTVQPSNSLFSTLAELQPYDTILLANVPREHFTDEQIPMLVSNTQHLGAGLVMLGGPNSFGAGGWAGTELERAMPVDFQIQGAKVVPVGALAIVMDCSGSMAGQKVELSKSAAIAAVATLGRRDYVGVVTFNSAAQWVVPVRQADSADAISARIRRIGAGGGTNMQPGILGGYQALSRVDASVKHMIVLSDGRTEGSGYEQLAARIHREHITISAVAVGPDADVPLLAGVAGNGGGKFYRVLDPRALPRIFTTEARRVARPLIFDARPVQPRMQFTHEILSGVEAPLPPIRGFVLTTKKDSPLVEVPMVSLEPAGEKNGTLLATWIYGQGRAVAFTSDAGARWTGEWFNRPLGNKVFSQIVRWSMRPTGESEKFTVAAHLQDNRVQTVVAALDKDDAFLNFLQMTGRAIGPDLKPVFFALEQTAPGRYVGSFPADKAGAYFVAISHGMPGTAPVLRGVNVPSSNEFRDRAANESLLSRLAEMVPKDGKAGVLINVASAAEEIGSPLSVDSFRNEGLPKPVHNRDIWHCMVILSSCLFFFDVLIRRVQVNFAWAPSLARRALAWLAGRSVPSAQPETIERLRSRKAEVASRLEQVRAASRFESPPDVQPDIANIKAATDSACAEFEAAAPSLAEGTVSEMSYTERLMQAKQSAWERHRSN